MLDMPKLKKVTQRFQRIAFFGPMCSGKTWCASYLKDDYGYNTIAFAGKLKAIAYDLYGIQDKNGPNRAILQELGGVDLRKPDPDVWIKHALYRAQYLEEIMKGRGLVLDDLRYLNEARALKNNGFVLVKVNCDEDVRQKRIERLYPDYSQDVHNHASEIGWKEMTPDFEINSTTGYETMAQLDAMVG